MTYSRPVRVSRSASARASSMVAGSRSTPSSVAMIASVGSRPFVSTWCTEMSRASGSMPRLKVRHACGSRSTNRTPCPCSASAAPREATVFVLATPPFWLATASTWVLVITPYCAARVRPHHARLAPLTARLLEIFPICSPGGARTAERHLQGLPAEPGHVGQQPVVVQQQRGRRGLHHQPQPAAVRLPREHGTGEQVVVGGLVAGALHEPQGYGAPARPDVDRRWPVADLRPGVLVRRAGAARAEADAGLLRDDRDLDLAVEVTGAD